MFKGLMTGVSGVRGIVGEGMTPEVALLWSSGFGTWLKGQKVLLARDSRPSGEMLSHAVLAGLSAAGCDVDEIGIVPPLTLLSDAAQRVVSSLLPVIIPKNGML